MGLKRRPGIRAVPILIPIALCGLIPASVLRNLPLVGTLQDLLDQVFTKLIVTQAFGTDEKRRTK